MSDWIQWGIAAIIGILSFLAGRYWNLLDRRLAKDKNTYQELLELLPASSMQYLKENDFGGAISRREFSIWSGFCERCKHPDFVFLDRKLENAKTDLFNKMDLFTERIAIESFSLPTGVEYNQITPADDRKDPKQFEIVRKELNDLSIIVYSAYVALVNRAIKTLL